MGPAFAGQVVPSAIFVVTAILWLGGELRQALRRREEAVQSDRYSLWVLRGCIALGVFLAIWLFRSRISSLTYSPFVFGTAIALMWSGMVLRWWSFWTLGRYFTFTVMTSRDQQVIASGPYRLLRHPSYTGMLLALAGLGMIFGNWLSVLALVGCASIGFAYRIRVEEAALLSMLGAEYTQYAQKRRRLVPLIW